MSAKNPKPKILSVVRSDTYVEIRRQVSTSSEQKKTPDPKKPGETATTTVHSSREFKEKSHEAPLPAFDEALQRLSSVACNMLGVPAEWKKGITVIGLFLTYTESGVRTAVISFVKNLDATGSLHPLKTPAFQVDDGKKTEDGRRQCAKSHAEDVIDFIKQAQKYAEGERSQQLLDFEEEGDEDEKDNVEQLPGMAAGADGDN